jgi:transposase InsO family protein
LFVADYTYVPLSTGVFASAAFVVDAYAGTIVGWDCSTSKVAVFVDRAIRQAATARHRQGYPLLGNTIHRSDAGSQYTSVHFVLVTVLVGSLRGRRRRRRLPVCS